MTKNQKDYIYQHIVISVEYLLYKKIMMLFMIYSVIKFIKKFIK